MREYTTSHDSALLEEMNLGDNFICDAINDGFPLCCVVSTDNFLKHGIETYKHSILITPIPESPDVLQKLKSFASQGISVIMYGTKAKIDSIEDFDNLIKTDVKESPSLIREKLSDLGYRIEFSKKDDTVKPPTMAISRRDNGLVFSVYNSNTTTDAKFCFPLGAPILIGCEAEMTDGKASYRFSRGEQRECRIYAHQSDGFISCREWPAVNARYRRAIKIAGLKDATVRVYTEPGRECSIIHYNQEWINIDFVDTKMATDAYGTYIEAERLNGDFCIVIGHDNTL
jgi:hypothetical protein